MTVRDNMVPFKVVVIGAGLGGLACAIACCRAGLNVEIFEKAPKIEQVRRIQLILSKTLILTISKRLAQEYKFLPMP
jgi:2-polyprenyl-6-methoxyphenol hydroxylase-like FAD-dependent oxidoreductase